MATLFSRHHALTLMPLLWQSMIRCCQSCIDTLALISVIAGVISFMADSLIGVPFTLFECLEYFSLVNFTIFCQPYLDVGYLVSTLNNHNKEYEDTKNTATVLVTLEVLVCLQDQTMLKNVWLFCV